MIEIKEKVLIEYAKCKEFAEFNDDIYYDLWINGDFHEECLSVGFDKIKNRWWISISAPWLDDQRDVSSLVFCDAKDFESQLRFEYMCYLRHIYVLANNVEVKERK